MILFLIYILGCLLSVVIFKLLLIRQGIRVKDIYWGFVLYIFYSSWIGVMIGIICHLKHKEK